MNILTLHLKVVQQQHMLTASRYSEILVLSVTAVLAPKSWWSDSVGCEPNIPVDMVSPGASNVQKRWGSRTLGFGIIYMVDVILSRSLSYLDSQGMRGRRQCGGHKLPPSKVVTQISHMSLWLLSLCPKTWPKQLWGKQENMLNNQITLWPARIFERQRINRGEHFVPSDSLVSEP